MNSSTDSASSLPRSPAMAVLDRALERGRLAHSLLLYGNDASALERVALHLADRLLNSGTGPSRPPQQHPDCFTLRPAGKMRLISADATRSLIGRIQHSSQLAERKVALVYDADRMHLSAANIFLKTLEEPPGNTSILLLTSRPYALLPTIRSRCLHFRFPGPGAPALLPEWTNWLADYRAWLAQLRQGSSAREAVSDSLFGLYGLVARFESILTQATDETWKAESARLPEGMAEEERDALEEGLRVSVRHDFFTGIEVETRNFAAQQECAEDFRQPLIAAVEALERNTRLLRLNLKESAVLENFLLFSLRTWFKRSA